MINDSGDRSNQVQDGENNDSGEQSPIPIGVQEDTGMRRKMLQLIESKNLKAE